jgi:hypothetical protein
MKILPILALSLAFLFPGMTLAETDKVTSYEEVAFLKEFAGKDADYVKSKLGEPDSIDKRENASGVIEFWVYHDLVKQQNSDKIYKFTQVGIVNNYVETLGHTNRLPGK